MDAFAGTLHTFSISVQMAVVFSDVGDAWASAHGVLADCAIDKHLTLLGAPPADLTAEAVREAAQKIVSDIKEGRTKAISSVLALKASQVDANKAHQRIVSGRAGHHTSRELKQLLRESEQFWSHSAVVPTRIADTVRELRGGGARSGTLSEEALSLIAMWLESSLA